MIKLRTIPETNSSSSHALVLPVGPPKNYEHIFFGPEIINYAIKYVEENIGKRDEFIKYILSDPEIKESFEEYDIEDQNFEISGYSVPVITNYSPKEKHIELFKLYKEVIKTAIKEGIGVEVTIYDNPQNKVVPYLMGVFNGDAHMRIYRPGNYTLYILNPTEYYDGNPVSFTRIKILDDGETEYIPTIPESIDVKITNKCFAMCPFCHENSVPDGEHAEDWVLEEFVKMIEKTPIPEITIGGGNPLLHPHLEWLASELLPYSTVSITARDIDYIEYGFPKEFSAYGISYTSPTTLLTSLKKVPENKYVVIHFINGVHRTEDVAKAIRIYTEQLGNTMTPAVLILGFKTFGRGKNWKVRNTIDINAIMEKYPNTIISLDNLAIKQLNAKKIVKPIDWELFYNGEDGRYTMYVDLVRRQYARNSYSEERHNIRKWDIKAMFSSIL